MDTQPCGGAMGREADEWTPLQPVLKPGPAELINPVVAAVTKGEAIVADSDPGPGFSIVVAVSPRTAPIAPSPEA